MQNSAPPGRVRVHADTYLGSARGVEVERKGLSEDRSYTRHVRFYCQHDHAHPENDVRW